MKLPILIRNLIVLCLVLLAVGAMRPSASAAKVETAVERWRQDGPPGGVINVVHRTGSVVLAGTAGGGIYRATAIDGAWTHVESYEPASTLNQYFAVFEFAHTPTAIFAVTNLGIYRSLNQGVSWKRLENLVLAGDALSLAVTDGALVAGLVTSGVWRSTDNGDNWVASNLGLTVGTYSIVRNLGATFFAVGPGARVFRSIDGGRNWTPVGAGLPASIKIYDIEIVDAPERLVFVATAQGIFRSSDNGANFVQFDRGIPSEGKETYDLSFSAGDIFAATGSGVYYSTDRGLNWLSRQAGITTKRVNSVFAANGKHLAGTVGDGVFFTENNGANWSANNTNLFAHSVQQIYAMTTGTLLAGMAMGGGIWRSDDGGATWQRAAGAPPEANCFVQSGSKVLAGTPQGELYISGDNGANWAVRSSALPDTQELLLSGTTIFAATLDGVYRSTDEGGAWTRVSAGLPATGGVNSIVSSGGRLWVGTFNGVYVSTNQGDSWTPQNASLTELSVLRLSSLTGGLFAGTTNGIFVYNFGTNKWSAINNGLPAAPGRVVRGITTYGSGGVLFAGTSSGVFYSIDGGQSWIAYSNGLTHGEVQSLWFSSGRLFAGTSGNSIFSIGTNDFACRWTLTPASRTHGATAGSDTVTVNDPFICNWTASSNAPWLTLSNLVLGRVGSATYSFTANTTGATRTGTLTIAGQTFTVTQTAQAPNPLPVLSTVTPNVITEGGTTPFAIAVTGSNFVNGAQIRWNGTALTTTFVSATRLTAMSPVSIDYAPLSVAITVINPAPGGGVSAAMLPIVLERKVVSVSAASYSARYSAAANSIVAAFGLGMATDVETARSIPLPTSLLGTVVRIKDSAGVERPAPLFFVAQGQINFLVPPETAVGNAEVRVTRSDGKRFYGNLTITPVEPGIFTANANGLGVPAALTLNVTASGALSYFNIARFDTLSSSFVPQFITFGAATDQLFLILYGTGLRGTRSPLSAHVVNLGGINVTPVFIGPAPGFVGLDQMNVPLPRSLAGRGSVDVRLTLDGITSNTVTILFR